MSPRVLIVTLLLLLSAVFTSAGFAAPTAPAGAASNPQFEVRAVDDAWRAQLPLDAKAATQAYLDRLSPQVVTRVNAYQEGGYWLQLWNFLLGLTVSAVLLSGRRSARLRDWAQRTVRKALLRDSLYGAAWVLIGWLLTLPLSVYEGHYREHAYGMATQTFGAWLVEQLIGLGVSCVVGALAIAGLYALIRRSRQRWWLWGTGGAIGLLMLMLMVGPVWIDPLFNTYRPVADGEVKAAVLAMAHANGVPADNVLEFDASRQTTRISANVSGIFGTAAVRLNDNLLRRTSLPEIRAVMGHELGHFVMNHIYKVITMFALLLLAGFLFAQWAMDRLLQRIGPRCGLEGVADVASLPLLAAVFSVFLFAATPILNTITRVQETEADRFGLNLSREPHGMAEAFLKLTEYRKPEPGPVEEFIFFHHPSTRARVYDAMRWREAMAGR